MDNLPKPYFQLGGATLYKGDCREILPLLPRDSVDLIVTDPPYEVNFRSNHGQNFNAMAGDETGEVMRNGILAALPLLRRGRHIYVFGLRDFGEWPISGRAELVWDKQMIGMGNLTIPWANQHEMIAFGVYQISKANRESGTGRLAARLRHGSVLRHDRKNSVGGLRHPTEKPVSIIRQMIESSSLIGETVLDPFAGSGSTLVAALIEGRKAVGIELDVRYCDVAAERIEEAAAWAAMMPK